MMPPLFRSTVAPLAGASPSFSSTCTLGPFSGSHALAAPRAGGLFLHQGPPNPAALAPGPQKQQRRGFVQYLNRKDWFPWRERLIRARQRNAKRKRNILPRWVEEGEREVRKERKTTSFMFEEQEMVISMKKRMDYGRIVKKQQVDDAMENLVCLNRPSIKKLLDLLERAKREASEKYKLDPARLYVHAVRSWGTLGERRPHFATKSGLSSFGFPD